MSDYGGYDAFALYHGLKLHFTTNYDFIKYNGKITIGKDAFALRKDKFFFYKLSRKYHKDELTGFFVSNLLENPKIWSGELLSDDCDSTYKVWKKRQESMSYVFKNEISTAFESVDTPDDLLKVVDGEYPLLYNLYQDQTVSLETIIILDKIFNFIPKWQKKVNDDLLFPDFIKKVNKYKPFLIVELNKYVAILKAQLKEFA